MKLKLLIICAALSIPVHAKTVGMSASVTDDNEGNSSVHANSYYMVTDKLGVRYGKTNYHTPNAIDMANRFSLVVNTKIQNTKIFGDIGVGDISGKTYFIGDTTLYQTINKYLSIFAGIDGDIVDSDLGIAETITHKGWNAGVDLYNDHFGITGLVRESYFTDGNIREGWFVKLYYTPFDGVSIYTSTKHFHNSDEDNGNYYSPSNYERNSVGVSYNYVIKGLLLSGQIEAGKQGTNDDSEDANAFKVSIGPALKRSWSWRISYIADRSGESNYRYNTVVAEIVFDL